MSNSGNHNSGTVAPKAFGVSAAESRGNAGDTPATTRPIRHVYVHIPFCAHICPYCAFYKDLLDRSHTSRFCEALLRELEFFFSSRRRHTRWPRDWSSDVCSSDLYSFHNHSQLETGRQRDESHRR